MLVRQHHREESGMRLARSMTCNFVPAINNLRLRSASRSRRPVGFVSDGCWVVDILADATVQGMTHASDPKLRKRRRRCSNETELWAAAGTCYTWMGAVVLDSEFIAKLVLHKSLTKQDSSRRWFATSDSAPFQHNCLPFNSTARLCYRCTISQFDIH